MVNDLSILQSKSPLTKYEEGVIFKLNTFGTEYEIDSVTAQKLSDLLLTPGDTKFVKIRTRHGQVVLNTSGIKEIVVDESPIEDLLDFIETYPDKFSKGSSGHPGMSEVFELTDEKIEYFWNAYQHYGVPRWFGDGDPPKDKKAPVKATRETFERYWRQEAAKHVKIKHEPK